MKNLRAITLWSVIAIASLALAVSCSFNLAGNLSKDDENGGGDGDVCDMAEDLEAECTDAMDDMMGCFDSDISGIEDCEGEIDGVIDCFYEVDDVFGECGEDVFDCMYNCDMEADNGCFDDCGDGFDDCAGTQDCPFDGDGGDCEGDCGNDPCMVLDEMDASCSSEMQAMDTCAETDPATDPNSCGNRIDELISCVNTVDTGVGDCLSQIPDCMQSCADGDYMCEDQCDNDFQVCAGLEGCDMGGPDGPNDQPVVCDLDMFNDCGEILDIYVQNGMCNIDDPKNTNCDLVITVETAPPYQIGDVAEVPDGTYLEMAICDSTDYCWNVSNDIYCGGPEGTHIELPICGGP